MSAEADRLTDQRPDADHRSPSTAHPRANQPERSLGRPTPPRRARDGPVGLGDAATKAEDVATPRREYYEVSNVVNVDVGPGGRVSLDVVWDTAVVIARERQIGFEVPDRGPEVAVDDEGLSPED